MENPIIKFNGTLADWAFLLAICVTYVIGKYVNRPKPNLVLKRNEVMNILVGLSLYRNMEHGPDKKKELESLRVKVSKDF